MPLLNIIYLCVSYTLMHFSIVKLMLIKMKSSFSFIFFVFSVSCIAFASGGAQDFRQYFLVQTWPPVYCQVQRPEPCRIKPSKFVLHGLWPVNSSGRSSTNTNNQTINLQDMVPASLPWAIYIVFPIHYSTVIY